MRPRRLVDVGARPLNFTVRGQESVAQQSPTEPEPLAPSFGVARCDALHLAIQKGVSEMFTLILTLIISQPSCSGPNCIGYSTIATVPGFESFGLCEQAGQNWVKTIVPHKQSDSAKYVCVQLR